MKDYRTIEIDKLRNFYENPRHETGENDKDTLTKLIRAVGIQQMMNLAKDIAENGLIPGQQLIVVPSNGDAYVVYEGNRRIAAIKMLLDPSEYSYIGENNIRKLEELSSNNTIPKEFLCYVTDEKEALFIMERRHLGEDNGRGIKNWGSKEKGKFGVLQGKKKTMSFLLEKYSKQYLDGYEITTILPYTTLDRIFNKKGIKDKIGLDINDESTYTKERMQLVRAAATWIVDQAAEEGQSVTRVFNTKEEIENRLLPWIESYDFSKIEDKGKEKTNSSNKKNENKESNERKRAPRGTGSKDNLPYFFQGLKYGQLNPNNQDTHGVSAVCNELHLFSDKKLVSVFPIAATFLVRSLIEQSLIYYAKRHYVQGQDKKISDCLNVDDKLSNIIKNYKKNLPNYIEDKRIRQYYNDLFANYEDTVDPLNWVIHRTDAYRIDANTLIELPQKGLLTVINYLLDD